MYEMEKLLKRVMPGYYKFLHNCDSKHIHISRIARAHSIDIIFHTLNTRDVDILQVHELHLAYAVFGEQSAPKTTNYCVRNILKALGSLGDVVNILAKEKSVDD